MLMLSLQMAVAQDGIDAATTQAPAVLKVDVTGTARTVKDINRFVDARQYRNGGHYTALTGTMEYGQQYTIQYRFDHRVRHLHAFRVSHSDNDAYQVYIRYGAPPTAYQYDCRTGPYSDCLLDGSQVHSGDWFLTVVANEYIPEVSTIVGFSLEDEY